MNAKLAGALLALAVVASGVATGAPITDLNSHLNTLDDHGTDADGSFGADVVEVHQNDTATIPMALNGTDTATLRIGSEAVNFVLVVTVTDGDGDGEVTLRFDTAVAETDQRSVRTESAADTATVRSKTAPDDPPLAVGNYPLDLFAGNTTADDREVAVATLAVTRPQKTTDSTAPTDITTEPTRATTDQPMMSSTVTRTTTVVSDPEPGIPGFGVPVALVALVAAAVLVARRWAS